MNTRAPAAGAATTQPLVPSSGGAAGLSTTERIIIGQMMAESVYRQVCRALEASGVEHLLLKGPHLGAIAYEEPWHRRYGDLDILVREACFSVAVDALKAAGFMSEAAPSGRDATHAGYYNHAVVSPNGLYVEVHRAFEAYGLYRIDYDALFERSVPFKFGKTASRGLSPEDLLLNLVVHAAKSLFRVIEAKHVEDVAALSRAQLVDWQRFSALAKASGSATAAWVLLSAACTLHRAAIPAAVLRGLEPSVGRKVWLRRFVRWDRFPMSVGPGRPLWAIRLGLGPVIVDRFRDSGRSAFRFALTRAKDVALTMAEGHRWR